MTDTVRNSAEFLEETDSLRAEADDLGRAEGRIEAVRGERDTIIALLKRVADSFAIGLAHSPAAARESRREWEEALQAIGHPTMVIDPDYSVVAANRAALKIADRPPDELLGRKCYEVCHGSDGRPEGCPLHQVPTSGEPEIIEREMTALGHQFLASCAPILDSEGRLARVIHIATDITERRRAEDALRESRRNLKSIFDTLDDFLFVLDTDGRVVHFNPVAERRLGYSAEQLRGMDVRELHPPERREEAAAIMADLLADRVRESSIPLMCRDGTPISVETKVSRGNWDGKEVLFGICRDVAERERVQAALRARDAILEAVAFAARHLLTGAPCDEGVLDMLARLGRAADVSGVYVFGNEEAEDGDLVATQRYEWTASAEPSREANSEWVSFPWRDGGMGRWESLLAGGRPVAGHVSELPASERRVLAPQNIKSIVAVPVEVRGQWWGFIGFGECQVEREWSSAETEALRVAARVLGAAIERREGEERLFAYQERLRSLASELALAEERVRRRIATALHDRIGQNLALSKVKLGQLGEEAASAGLDGQVAEVRDLIDSAVRDTRSLTFELSPPILYEVGLEAAIDWLADQIHRDHKIEVRFHDDRQPKPLDDHVRVVLYQATRELLLNIVKHANASAADVSVRLSGQEVQIVVEDNGQGLDIAKLPPNVTESHGFGLFSIRERLSLVGGHLDIESEIGNGCRMTLWAPIKKERDG